MTIDESIKLVNNRKTICEHSSDRFIRLGKKQWEYIAELLEKLRYIEAIILNWNAGWYNDEDTGIPDNEILEAIYNACNDNGFDIPVDEDFMKGYNKALDDIVTIIKERVGMDWEWDFMFIEQIAEELKAGGKNE